MTEETIKDAIERFKQSQDGSYYNRETAYEDTKFSRLADQWPDNIRQQRQEEGRPCLTINKMPAFIRQVVNDSRQNKPAIKVSPVDESDIEKADVIAGLIRSIERRSCADVAYDTAIDHAVSGGFGFFRISIDYTNDYSFDLEAKIERIANPLMVHWDVSSLEFDASDWNYAFVSEFLDEDEFKAKYKDAEPVDFETDFRTFHPDFLQEGKIQISEYWEKVEEDKKLFRLSNGKSIREDHMTDEIQQLLQFTDLSIQQERIVKAKRVIRRLISGAEVLEEDDWPGSTIPICPVWGEEVFLDGRRYFRSMIRDARDSQTMFNFWRSASTELVALAPRAPWVGPLGFVPKGKERVWETANTRSHAYLEYDPQAGGVPQRTPFAGVPAGALQEALNSSDDMKSIIGIYDSSLGARSNETSGRAILARQREADVSNFHFTDNLTRAIRYAGKCLVEIIPSVYGKRQAIRILGEDETDSVVKLGQVDEVIDGEKLYDLTTGEYDVTVKAGPSYATQREEARESLIEIMRAVPGAGQYIGDIVLEHLDFQNADKVAKRLKLLLPPNVQEAELKENMPGMPPEAQQAIMQLQGMVKQLQGELQKAQSAPEMKKAEADMQSAQLEGVKVKHEMGMDERKMRLEEMKVVQAGQQGWPDY